MDNNHTSERIGRGGRADSSNRKPYLETHNGGSWARLMAKWNEDKIIGSTTPGSSHRGSRSLPGQCGPANMRYSWSSHVNNKYYNQPASAEENTWLQSCTLFGFQYEVHLENGVPLLQHNLIPPKDQSWSETINILHTDIEVLNNHQSWYLVPVCAAISFFKSPIVSSSLHLMRTC